MKTTIDMPLRMKEQVNQFYQGDGVCICGVAIVKGQDRALLAQPNSFDSKEPGTITIRAFCRKCFDRVTGAIMECRKR